MDAVVLGFFFPVGMHAAASYYRYVRIVADVKVVIYQVIDVRMGDAGGNVNCFALGFRLDDDVDAGLSVFELIWIARWTAARRLAVFPDVVSAAGHPGQVGHQLQQVFGNLIHGRIPPDWGRTSSFPL